ncbi:MAG: hypothetical protein ACPGRE_00790 [Flavobacteriaceae bacterium]
MNKNFITSTILKVRIFVIILLLVPLVSCNSIQEVNDDELKVLNDVLNDFILKERYLIDIQNAHSEQPKYILLSDTLGTVSSFIENNPKISKHRYDIEEYNLIFDQIIKSTQHNKDQFLDLNKINLENNVEFHNSANITSSYFKYKLSRIAFDQAHENGVMAIEESLIQDGEKVQGYKAVLLIRKQVDGKWSYISRVNQSIRLMDEANFSKEYFPWKESMTKLAKSKIIEHIENENNLLVQSNQINTETLNLKGYAKLGDNFYNLDFKTTSLPQVISVSINTKTGTIRGITIYTPK